MIDSLYVVLKIYRQFHRNERKHLKEFIFQVFIFAIDDIFKIPVMKNGFAGREVRFIGHTMLYTITRQKKIIKGWRCQHERIYDVRGIYGICKRSLYAVCE